MSCFVVSNKHIGTLVAWYGRCRFCAMPDERAGGQLLLDANIKAFRDRYDGQYDEDLDGEPFVRLTGLNRMKAHTMTPVQILKMCRCLDYQCSDADDWESSEAHMLLNRISASAIEALPGYDNAAWDI